MRLLPREEKFFALFLKQVENITEASRLMQENYSIYRRIYPALHSVNAGSSN